MSGEAGQDDGAGGLHTGLVRRGERAWPYVIRLALGIGLGLAIAAIVLRGIDYRAVGTILASADTVWLVFAATAVLATTLAKIVRWRALFPRGHRPGLYVLGRTLLVGQLTNFAVPLRAGGLVRAYLIGNETTTDWALALATIAAEKAFDVLFLLILGGLVSIIAPLPGWLTASLGALAFAGLALLAFALAIPAERMIGLARRLAKWVPRGLGGRLVAAVRSGLSGLVALRDPRLALIAIGWTAIAWMLAAVTNMLVFKALDMQPGAGAALLQLLVHMTPLPADTPGRIGVHQGLTVVGLAPYGIDGPSQIAYAAALYGVVYIPQVLLGLASLALTIANQKWTKSRDLGSRTGV